METGEIYDVLIIGCGLSGLTAAIRLHEAGMNILVVTKESNPLECNTYHAQGGIIAWKQGDSPESLKQDILEAGMHCNNETAVEELVAHGPRLVFDFLVDHIGTQFSRDADGQLAYTGEAAHSERRILHFEDRTGEQIETSIHRYAQEMGLNILCEHTAIDLITNNHHSENIQETYKPREVMGAYILDNATGQVKRICAKQVVLASGGIGNLYQHTTNPAGATGDGISMAYHAGADIINAEYIQFHPTCLFHRDIKRFLISESLRGEGARLLDIKGRTFMKDYSPMEDLAPRDIVARSIFNRMGKDGTEYVLLDLYSHYQGQEPIAKRFSRIYSTCMEGGIDITKEPIPVVPAAHYFCGGVKVNLVGKTSLENLYALGEVSCTGVHGANRLASTSLLEALLWGYNCADDIIKGRQKPTDLKRFADLREWEVPPMQEEFDPLLLQQDWKAIQLTMWNYVGIIRTRKGLRRAQADLGYFSHRIIQFYQEAQLNRDIIELRHAITAAGIITNAALRNNSPKGCHYME
ncbi:MAG: L-aspartate oxidase [Sphaerochaeta sp.]|jgi:L-aspartate oxidase|nr:L-aspartate oxidase [Sphaerochaeta sp.]